MAGSVNRAILASSIIAGMWSATALADNIIPAPPNIPVELQAPPMHVGDIVYLKSGSPALVITQMNEEKGIIVVTWFVNGDQKGAYLPSVAFTRDPDKRSFLNERKCQ